MKIYILIILVIFVVGFYFLLNRNGNFPKPIGDPVEAYQNLIKENSAGMDKSIQIFAKVFDGDTDKPLQGVLIEVKYTHFSPTPPLFFRSSIIKAVSDENGLFFIDNIKCRNFYLNNISLENYWEKGQRNTFPDYNFINYKANKDKPAIFKLYKEVKDNYIFKSNSRTIRVQSGESKNNYFGLFEHFNVDREMEKYDFLCNAELKNNKTTINLKGFDSFCSFYLCDKDFIDQEDLSKFENTLVIEKIKGLGQDEEKLHYLFIRFGKLQLYVRAKLKIQLNGRNSFIDFEFEINPFGEYNFETFDRNKLSSDTRIAIKDEFEEKLKKGVLPKREDMKKYLNIPVSENTTKPIEDIKTYDLKNNIKNSKMNFYGKAVDENGKAIPGAIVVFKRFFFNDSDEIKFFHEKVKADKDGVFALENVRGYKFKVEDIFKYEYFRNRVIRGNFDDKIFINNFSGSYVPNKNAPEVFQVSNELSGNFNDIDQFFVPAIIKSGEEKEFLHQILLDITCDDLEKYDIKVNINLLKDKCLVKISNRDEKDSFVINDSENLESMNQKPVHDSSFEFLIGDDSKIYKRYEKYLLVKFLGSRFYAKLHLDFLIGNSECQYFVESRINLFGTKEFDDFKKTKYTGSIYKHLRDRNDLKASNGEMEGVSDKNDFIKEYNNPFLKAQFKVPPETDPRLEIHVDEMKELLQYRIFEEDEKK